MNLTKEKGRSASRLFGMCSVLLLLVDVDTDKKREQVVNSPNSSALSCGQYQVLHDIM